MEPQISIIVPVYNVADYLPKCIESILAQTFTDFELILINDGSPDKSPQICDHYASQDSRVRVIHKKNGGVSEARNCGLDIARGKYIGFADSDDWLAHDMFELLYNLSEKHDADISICGHYVVTDDSTEPLYEYFEGEIIYSNVEGVQKIVEDVEIQSYLWNKLFKESCLKVSASRSVKFMRICGPCTSCSNTPISPSASGTRSIIICKEAAVLRRYGMITASITTIWL